MPETHTTYTFEYRDKQYGAEDILHTLTAAGLARGKTAFVHSDLKSFGKINPRLTRRQYIHSFVTALKRAVGTQGNILMPTFSYTFTKKQTFYPLTTPSTVGMMTEYFRTLPGVTRSIDPIFSIAAYGPDQRYFTDVGTNCFGAQSIFEKLYKKNATIVFLGETFDITYMHFVEQSIGVPYRFIKEFTGNIKIGSTLKRFSFSYNVRPLDTQVEYDLDRIARLLQRQGYLTFAKLGHSKVRCIQAIDAYNGLARAIQHNTYALLKHPPDL